MRPVSRSIRLTAEAQWLLDEARALATSAQATAFDTVHVLAAALRCDTTFGSALRASPVGERQREIEQHVMERGDRRRLPVRMVDAGADVGPLLEVANRTAAAEGRARVDAEDVVWALTAAIGPHSRYFAASEPATSDALRTHGWTPKRSELPWQHHRPVRALTGAGQLIWTLWKTLVAGASMGITILVALPGILLHHAAVEMVGIIFHFRAGFRGWLEQVGGRFEASRVLSPRETFAATLLVRLLLAMLGTMIFAAVLLEFRGIGLSPAPSFTRDPAAALGSRDDVDLNTLLLMFTSWRPFELWIAVGAAFMALPTYAEVHRIRSLLRTGQRRHHRATAAVLRPVQGVTRLFDRFDAVTTQLNFPTMLSSGVAGVLACALTGAMIARIVIAAA
jgi:hypothetical protein